ncbi:Zn-dependent hydrolase [Caulobacter sp. SL161]|uniref:Zn-dependent hydrolase n=1 Tax=Caulobacter sp. SL161 TaxID=2995156 RepID=UPI00227296FF|nr:Zn-dependent hydrolase [Caulobacter sp. SL161]MCY1646617.1 Zn-dependent hydrolase [Caulobacter sp. SL161]
MTSNLRINADRLWASLMEMAQIGATALGGCNRQALTDLDRQGRDLFVAWAKAAGCSVRIDAVGNIFARRHGRDDAAEPVLTGSHLDTQATGGKFDGVYGVLAGLEVLRVLQENQIETDRPIEVACWTNEEGCRFAPAMLGSGVFSGAYDLEFAYSRRDRDGFAFGEELERIGYKGDQPVGGQRYAAVFETHIEQGPILEHEGDVIGVVTGIQGAYWFDLTLTGASAHAGPTPMSMRRDPWRAAAPIVNKALAIAEANAPWGRATIGDIKATPGARNTVPESLTLTIDIRHPDTATLEAMVAELRAFIDKSAAEHSLQAGLETVWYMPPTAFDEHLVGLVEAAAFNLGASARRMVSGAGHDALHLAQVAPTAMIFVPCEGGVSHNEIENAKPEDLVAGANVLLLSMLAVAGRA